MAREIRLVASDVDGTLLNPKHELTVATKQAVDRLRDAGIQLALVSSRPARGMNWLLTELNVQAPCAAFRGGLVLRPDLSVIDEKDLPAGSIAGIVDTVASHQLDVWLYTRDLWLASRLDDPYVRHNADAVRFGPELFRGLAAVSVGNIVKLVAVGSRDDDLSDCEGSLRNRFGNRLSATRSQSHFHLHLPTGSENS